MKAKLVQASCVLALPLALVLAAAPASASLVQPSRHKAATKATTTKATPAKSTTTAKPATTVSHSIHDWQPGSVSPQTTRTTTTATPAGSRRSLRGQGESPRERAVEVNDPPPHP